MAKKRSAPASASLRRRSGRLSGTPNKKNTYFESPDTSEDELATPVKKRGKPSNRVAQDQESSEDQYKSSEEDDDEEDDDDDDFDAVEEEDDDDEEEEDDDDEEDGPPRKRGKSGAKATGAHRKSGANGDESEMDEDAPPKVTILPLEKLRDTGGIDYGGGKLHNNTLLFLADLKKNNRREWLKSHDKEYRRSLNDWHTFVEAFTENISEIDPTVPELPVKDVAFRIHRDIRFSKDQTPYKPHFSASWSRTGRKGPYAVYYLHCEPKHSIIGGGLWMPEKGHIDKLRRSIDRHPTRWREVLNEPHFKRVYFPGVKPGAGREKAVAAFLEENKFNALKKKPADWNADHRDIKLLRLRNFTVTAKLDDDTYTADDARDKIADGMQAISGFVSFLNSIVMPDATMDNLDDDSSEEEEAEEAEQDGEDEEEDS